MSVTKSQSRPVTSDGVDRLWQRYQAVRQFSDQLCETLTAEDAVIQSMPDVSPTRWHLAHTTWFFETFVLSTIPEYSVYDDRYAYLFNSYYNAVGDQFPRPSRGLLSRPGFAEICRYREYVDEQMNEMIRKGQLDEPLLEVVEVGLNHEQQHQELILTDIKHVFSCNPLYPKFRDVPFPANGTVPAVDWSRHSGGLLTFGFPGGGFHFDNELPRHQQYLYDFYLADSLVTNGDYVNFIEDGGYHRPENWLSDGWATVNQHHWEAPLYWVKTRDQWFEFTLAGLVPLDLDRPVCHVSYYEADAFARWAGARLPTEFEWEHAAVQNPTLGHGFADTLLEEGLPIHPRVHPRATAAPNLFGDVWQWTSSPYVGYPGYRPPEGAIGEYNGKFMCNQFVLRGGSCATSRDHIRPTYRNFFPPDARWQFSGIRLALDA